jgi:hypothetical protein
MSEGDTAKLVMLILTVVATVAGILRGLRVFGAA